MHWAKHLAAVLIIISLALPAHAELPPAGFSGCVISTSEGALRDVDCDRTPDPFDNCPLTNNPDQVDRDRNGIGDACDLVIDEIRMEPESPMQGRSLVVSVWLMNARAYPMRNVEVKLDVPKLGVAANERVSAIAPGERVKRELVVRVPECAATRMTDFAVIAEYPFAPGQKEVFSQALRAPVVASGTCETETGGDTTIVNILEVQDVGPAGAVYPFTIHNNQAESRAYVLSTAGLEWGYAEINPGTVIVIPAGEARDGEIHVWARGGVEGRRSFTFTVQARDDAKQVVLLANIPEQVAPPSGPAQQVFWGFVIFVLLVILAAVLLTRRSARRAT